MNFSLAREIYGLTPWFVDAHSLPGLLGVLNNVSSLETPEIKYNTPHVYISSTGELHPLNETRVITDPYGDGWYKGQLENNDSFEGIAVIKLDGPITLNGGASSLGMKQLSEFMYKLNADSRIVAFIVYANSGGGASGAVEVMSDTINEIKKTKPVYGLIQKGGMAASACFGILSACDKIYSESKMNIVGSAGTMIEFAGRKANSVDPDGRKYIRLYAPKSKRKNEGFEEALNNDNYEILVDDLLKPVNESFLSLLESNRPALKGTDFDDGHTLFSKDAIGTFIDGIKSFEQVISEVESDSKFKKSEGISFNNLNNSNMTKSELKSKHPELYNEVYNEGVKAGTTAEADRVGAWNAHLSTDAEAVLAGIESGKAITSKQTQELIVKQASKSQLENLASDSPESIAIAEAKKEGKEDATEVVNFYATVDSKLNLKK